MKRWIALTSVCLLALAFAPAQAGSKTFTKSYIGSYDPLSPTACPGRQVQGYWVGGACFTVFPKYEFVTLRVIDFVNSQGGFYWRFLNSNRTCALPGSDIGDCQSDGGACVVARNLPIPDEAAFVEILPSGVALGPLQCDLEGPGAAYFGEAKATFRF